MWPQGRGHRSQVVLCALLTPEKLCAQGPKGWDLLLDAEVDVQITDLGISSKLTLGSKLGTFCGNPLLAGLALFQGKRYDGPEVDIGSLASCHTPHQQLPALGWRDLKELQESVLRGSTGSLSTCP